MELYVLAGLGIVLLAQAYLFRLLFNQQRMLESFDDRFGRLTAGISLLTDTTECGLRDVAREVERLGQAPAPKKRNTAAVTRRIKTAARRGRKVADIAAAEQLSEGEVRLRLHLAGSPAEGALNGATVQ
jgi:hypothetical protein